MGERGGKKTGAPEVRRLLIDWTVTL